MSQECFLLKKEGSPMYFFEKDGRPGKVLKKMLALMAVWNYGSNYKFFFRGAE